MKRSQDESATCSTTKKRRVDYATFQKWQRDLDREYQTMTWLDCSSEKERGKKVVVQLKCKVCSDFVEKIRGRKNFSEKWIVGADSVRVSNVRDHAQNDQHTHTVCMYAKHMVILQQCLLTLIIYMYMYTVHVSVLAQNQG